MYLLIDNYILNKILLKYLLLSTSEVSTYDDICKTMLGIL